MEDNGEEAVDEEGRSRGGGEGREGGGRECSGRGGREGLERGAGEGSGRGGGKGTGRGGGEGTASEGGKRSGGGGVSVTSISPFFFCSWHCFIGGEGEGGQGDGVEPFEEGGSGVIIIWRETYSSFSFKKLTYLRDFF